MPVTLCFAYAFCVHAELSEPLNAHCTLHTALYWFAQILTLSCYCLCLEYLAIILIIIIHSSRINLFVCCGWLLDHLRFLPFFGFSPDLCISGTQCLTWFSFALNIYWFNRSDDQHCETSAYVAYMLFESFKKQNVITQTLHVIIAKSDPKRKL